MATESQQQKRRLSYKKPRLDRVRLVPEEAMLSACKDVTGSGTGKTNGNCSKTWECLVVGT